MKKVFFSAIALVAFSFAGMANEKKTLDQNNTKIENDEVIIDECVQFSFDASDAIMAISGKKLSPLEEGKLILALYDICDANRTN